MSEELIVRHCSPTLAGLKTGNMFSCAYTSEQKLRGKIRKLNLELSAKGLRILPLKISDGVALIYVYRPSKLKADLSCDDAVTLLKKHGYTCDIPEKNIIRLISKLKEQDGFPHEIGLFLGYPPEDVRGFIEKGAKHAKFSGHWRVYGDEQKAKQLFAKYKKCTDVYTKHHSMGRPINTLTVAV